MCKHAHIQIWTVVNIGQTKHNHHLRLIADQAQRAARSKKKSCCWNPTSRQRCPDTKGTHCTHSMYTYKCAEELSRKAVQFDNYYQDYYCFSGPHRNPCPVGQGYTINLWANYHSTSSEASFLNCCAESFIEYQTWRVWPSLIGARLPHSPSPQSHALTHCRPSAYLRQREPTPVSLILHWLMIHKWIA